MDLHQIKCFVNIAQTRNFTEAARRLGMAQSSVSRQIGELEKQLGARLFARTNREVMLTAEGKAFLPYAMEILGAADKGAFVIRQLLEGCTGRISLAVDPAASGFVAGCLKPFVERYPDIQVDLREVGGDGQLDAMRDQLADFYFMARDMLPDDPAYDSLETHREPLCLVAAETHPRISELAQLQQEQVVLLSELADPILYMEIMDIFQTGHVTPNVVNRYDSRESVLLAVASGVGVSVLPESLAQYPGIRRESIADMDAEIAYAAIWQQGSNNSAAALFLEILQNSAEGKSLPPF